MAGKISLKNVPMNIRNYMFPQEWIMFLKIIEEDKFMRRQFMHFKFLLWVGCRYDEGMGVTPNDIFDHGFLQIRRTKTRHKLGEVKGKTKPRQKKITQKQIRELKKYIKLNNIGNDEPLFKASNKTINRNIDKAFILMKHPFYKDWSWDAKKSMAVHNSGKEVSHPFSAHDIRRTHINYRIALGEDFELMNKECGHSRKVAGEVYLSASLFNDMEDKFLINQLLYN